MRVYTEKVIGNIVDQAVIEYTLKRFISEDEVEDLKTEIIEATRRALKSDHFDRDSDLITLTFSVKENE